MDPDEVAALVKEYAVEPWTTGTFTGYESRVSKQYLRHPDGVPLTVVEEIIVSYRETFPDLNRTVEEIICDGDTVAYRWTLTGTHSPEEPPEQSGRRSQVTYTGATILRLRGGEVIDESYESDGPALAEHLRSDGHRVPGRRSDAPTGLESPRR